MNSRKKIIIPIILILALALYFILSKKDDLPSLYFVEPIGETYSITTTTPRLLDTINYKIGDVVNVG
ncbi:MAG: hypothetical protein WBA54_00735, partial [Acidaminobacteraceae bacterium]